MLFRTSSLFFTLIVRRHIHIFIYLLPTFQKVILHTRTIPGSIGRRENRPKGSRYQNFVRYQWFSCYQFLFLAMESSALEDCLPRSRGAKFTNEVYGSAQVSNRDSVLKQTVLDGRDLN